MTTIGQQVEKLLAKGKSNEQIATAIRAKNKGAKTSPGSVAWYRSKLTPKAKKAAKAAAAKETVN